MNIFRKRSDLPFFTQERLQEGEKSGFVYAWTGYYLQKKHSWTTFSLRKQPTFGDATTCFPAKWRLRNEHKNSVLMTRQSPDLGSASDCLNQISHAAQPIRSTTQIWGVTRHQWRISAFVSQTSFGGGNSGGVAKCRLFPQPRRLCAWHTIICRQLFEGHAMGFRPMKRKKLHRMINVFVM